MSYKQEFISWILAWGNMVTCKESWKTKDHLNNNMSDKYKDWIVHWEALVDKLIIIKENAHN